MRSKVNVEKGRRGFVKVDIKRESRFTFVLTEKEMQEFVDKAERSGLNKSDYIRMLINKD
jgi:hypothetical protein